MTYHQYSAQVSGHAVGFIVPLETLADLIPG